MNARKVLLGTLLLILFGSTLADAKAVENSLKFALGNTSQKTVDGAADVPLINASESQQNTGESEFGESQQRIVNNRQQMRWYFGLNAHSIGTDTRIPFPGFDLGFENSKMGGRVRVP